MIYWRTFYLLTECHLLPRKVGGPKRARIYKHGRYAFLVPMFL